MRKKKLLLLFVLATGLLAAACHHATPAAPETASGDTTVLPASTTADPLTDLLEDYIGEYPRDAALFDEPAFRKRLEALVGEENFRFILTNFQTQTPLDYGRDYGRPDLIMTQGFEAHNAGVNDIAIAYNPATNNLMAKIVKSGDKPLRFQERPEKYPF